MPHVDWEAKLVHGLTGDALPSAVVLTGDDGSRDYLRVEESIPSGEPADSFEIKYVTGSTWPPEVIVTGKNSIKQVIGQATYRPKEEAQPSDEPAG
jgi:hypothetical protein